MAQDHDILADWFNLFQSLKKEHEIEIEDIYNMDEKRFMQRVVAKLRVWNKEINYLLRLGSELFASKPPLTIKK